MEEFIGVFDFGGICLSMPIVTADAETALGLALEYCERYGCAGAEIHDLKELSARVWAVERDENGEWYSYER